MTTSALTFDTFQYVKRLKAVGVTEEQAEVQAKVLSEIIHNNLTAQSDTKEIERKIEAVEKHIEESEHRLKQETTDTEKQLNHQIQNLDNKIQKLDNKIQNLGDKVENLNQKIDNVEERLNHKIDTLGKCFEYKLNQTKYNIIIGLGSLIIACTGLLGAIIKFVH